MPDKAAKKLRSAFAEQRAQFSFHTYSAAEMAGILKS